MTVQLKLHSSLFLKAQWTINQDRFMQSLGANIGNKLLLETMINRISSE